MLPPANPARTAIVLPPGQGRSYPMGRISAVFKADEAETRSKYSASEWWLEPHCTGPGAHAHPDDDVFYVLSGTMSFLINDTWQDAVQGTFILVPGGTLHDFENRSDTRSGLLNFSVPGGFEPHMSGIAQWFQENPPQRAGPSVS